MKDFTAQMAPRRAATQTRTTARKTFTVHTYAYPDERGKWRGHPVICYIRYVRGGDAHREYEVEAANGREAKKIAYRLRCVDEGFVQPTAAEQAAAAQRRAAL